MAELGMLLGGLLPTFLLSRLVLWLTKSWDGGNKRLYVVHGVSWLAVGMIGGLGMADDGPFAGGMALALYAIPQLIWLGIDLARHRGAAKAATAQPHKAGD